MPALIDLTGKQFGNLIVLRRAANDIRNKTQWVCKCRLCGSEKTFRNDRIKDGQNKACGCLRDAHKTKHGQTRSKEYRAWEQMKARCYRESDAGYKRYGGRGVKVCSRWMHSFENFLLDMGMCPKGMTLDRIDANGNYEPTNCRWATPATQANNRSNNVYVDYNGEVLTVAEVANKTGEPHHRILKKAHRGQLRKVSYEDRVRSKQGVYDAVEQVSRVLCEAK